SETRVSNRGASGPFLEGNHDAADAVRGPGVHQRAALRERRATPVRLLNGVTDRMRQRGFGDLACKLRLVPAPVPKRAAKSMGRDLDARADLLRESDHAGIRDWSTLRAGEDVVPRLDPLIALDRDQDRKRRVGQWHGMLFARLHAAGRNRPLSGVEVNL